MVTKLLKAAAVFFLLFVTLFSFTPPVDAASSQYVIKGNTSSKVVALTFDDGADGTNIPKILNTLSANNIKSTFFLTGSGTNHHPQAIRNIAAQGHELANHSYTHPDFTKISAAQMKNELSRTETIVKNTTGKSTKPLFRAPFGSTNASVLKAVGDAGYTHTIHWNIDTVDWKGNSKTDITNRVVKNIVPGSIVLMHTGAGASGTPGALPEIIKQLKAKGYKFVTVSELLKLKASTPPAGTGTTYTVKAGDTLYSIANRYKVSVSQLASANKLSNANVIRIGQKLIIPGKAAAPAKPAPAPAATVKHTVKSGDTLYSLSRKYGTTVTKIKTANKIGSSNIIRVGQVLTISK